MIGRLLSTLRKFFDLPKITRLELVFVSFQEADDILRRDSAGQWRIAKEEDKNTRIGYVYLERVQREW